MPRKPAETIAEVEQKELKVTTKTETTRGPEPLAPKTEEATGIFVEATEAQEPDAEAAKKHLVIRQNHYNHHYVAWEGAQGGAPIPQALKGTWTRRDKLQEQIDRYIQERNA